MEKKELKVIVIKEANKPNKIVLEEAKNPKKAEIEKDKTEYAKLKNDRERIDFLAKQMGLL